MATQRPRRFLDNRGMPTFTTIGIDSAIWRDVYHRMLLMPWKTFFAIAILTYSGMHVVFASLFMLEDGAIGHSDGSFLSSYFFSVQTMMTIGYGGMTPATTWANVIVTGEAFVGLLFTAMLTGLVFAKFTRPTSSVLWSKVAVIAMHEGAPTLMLRMANARGNRIVEASLSLVAAMTSTTKEGETFRKIRDLQLTRRSSPLFSVSWTAMHVIDEQSPLYGQTQESLVAQQLEIMAVLSGIDETSSQGVHARASYAGGDLRFGERFVDIIVVEPNGNRMIDYRKFHDTRPAPLAVISDERRAAS